MSDEGFDTFEHGADIGIMGWAPTLEGAFCECARAMFSQMVEICPLLEQDHSLAVPIEVEEEDLVSLLLLWLNTLLAEADINGAFFWNFEISICRKRDSYKLEGWARGYSREGLTPGIEVKGATYTQAKVERTERGWVVQCVIDL